MSIFAQPLRATMNLLALPAQRASSSSAPSLFVFPAAIGLSVSDGHPIGQKRRPCCSCPASVAAKAMFELGCLLASAYFPL